MEEVNPSDSSRYRKTYLPYPQYRVKSTNANGHELFFVPAKEILRGACLVPVLDRREENFLFEDNVQYCTDERRGLWYSIPPERMYVRPSDCYQSLVDSEYDNNLARKSPLSGGKVFYSIEEMAEQQRSVEIAVERDQRALFQERKEKGRGSARQRQSTQNEGNESDEECFTNDDDSSCEYSSNDSAFEDSEGEESS